jgi:UPF0716 protein FxsA
MSLISRLALLFVGIPLLELFLLIQLGQWVGLWPTIGLIALTGFSGAALARLEGLRTLWKVKAELSRGRLPGSALFDGLAILVGGALLLTPGILTDLLGFSFLLPPTRKVILRRIRQSLAQRLETGSVQFTVFPGPSGQGPRPWTSWGGVSGAGGGGRGVENPSPRPGEIVVEEEGVRKDDE